MVLSLNRPLLHTCLGSLAMTVAALVILELISASSKDKLNCVVPR